VANQCIGQGIGSGEISHQAGVFESLVNRASFVDKIVMSIWGSKRHRPLEGVQAGASRPIGGGKRLYARSIPVTLNSSGNEGEFKYGRFQPWKQAPPFRLVLRSVHTPLDQAQVDAAANSLMCKGYRINVAQIEMTFDTYNTSVKSFHQHLFTTARRVSILRDRDGNQTLYVGTPRSAWQLRVYQKTNDIVRLEYVLRLPFLREFGIRGTKDIFILRELDLSQSAGFMKFSQNRLEYALADLKRDWRKQLLLDWARYRRLELLSRILRQEHRVNPNPLLEATRVEVMLRRMQSLFVW
jgi:hypothetical protein